MIKAGKSTAWTCCTITKPSKIYAPNFASCTTKMRYDAEACTIKKALGRHVLDLLFTSLRWDIWPKNLVEALSI